MSWLDSLRAALDVQPGPVRFFFRDDDVGWEDLRLFALLDLFGDYDVPIDLAVIPKSVSAGTVKRLRGLIEARERISVHQHGYAHVNHELNGRKCEFGETRPRELQLADINAGKDLLLDLFGSLLDSTFTPPWNRCTATTTDCLRQTGFDVLSRDLSAGTMNVDGLTELPVAIDWFAHRKHVRLSADELGQAISAAVSSPAPVGVMLHHAVMDDEERNRLGELLELLSSHSQANCRLMRDLVREKF